MKLPLFVAVNTAKTRVSPKVHLLKGKWKVLKSNSEVTFTLRSPFEDVFEIDGHIQVPEPCRAEVHLNDCTVDSFTLYLQLV